MEDGWRDKRYVGVLGKDAYPLKISRQNLCSEPVKFFAVSTFAKEIVHKGISICTYF
jgi:hypothetical protein